MIDHSGRNDDHTFNHSSLFCWNWSRCCPTATNFTPYLSAQLTLLYFAVFCLILLYFVLLSYTLLYFVFLCFILFYLVILCFILFYFALLCFTLLYFAKQISQVPLRPAPLTAARTNRPIKEPFRGRNLHFSWNAGFISGHKWKLHRHRTPW